MSVYLKGSVPTPGSDEARRLACCCPVMDNARGRGAWGTSGPDAVFWINSACVLHAKQSAEAEPVVKDAPAPSATKREGGSDA